MFGAALFMKERENFSGHYEGNPYNGINEYGNGVYAGSFDSIEILKDNNTPEFIKLGVGISELCKLALVQSNALDADEDPIKLINLKCNKINKHLNSGVFDSVPIIKKSIKSAFRSSEELSSSLLTIFDTVVFEYFKGLISPLNPTLKSGAV